MPHSTLRSILTHQDAETSPEHDGDPSQELLWVLPLFLRLHPFLLGPPRGVGFVSFARDVTVQRGVVREIAKPCFVREHARQRPVVLRGEAGGVVGGNATQTKMN